MLAQVVSLAGIPPLSGFVAKLALVDAGVDARDYLIVAVSLAVSLLTLFSMIKIWSNAFWGEPRPVRSTPAGRGGQALMTGSTATLVALSIAIAVWAGPLYALSERTALDLTNPVRYVETVLGP